MNVMTIALKSIKQRLLASSLTGLSVALGVMLMVGVLVAYSVIGEAFQQRTIGYDLVVGRQGSDIQLVLSTVYRIGNPPANLPYRYYLQIREDPLVQTAVPITMGDTTQEGGFPIVGTTREYFDVEYAPGRKFFMKGDGFVEPFDAIIGSRVAQENHWTIDDPDTSEDEASRFKLVHGGQDASGGGHVHNEKFRVNGILKETGTANDRTVFVYLSGFYAVSGHETPLEEAKERERQFYGSEVPEVTDPNGPSSTPLAQKEVTAILVRTPNASSAVMLSGSMKKGHRAQAVNPIQVMSQLMTLLVGNITNALLFLTALVIVVSGISIFVSIYNSMSDRRKEIAIMRALGAQRRTVFAIVLTESILLCFWGGVIGGLLGHALVFIASPFVESATGLMMNPWAFHPAEFILLPALIVLASLVGFIPGMTAYRTDVARTLAD